MYNVRDLFLCPVLYSHMFINISSKATGEKMQNIILGKFKIFQKYVRLLRIV
jgi:hypothetical protein